MRGPLGRWYVGKTFGCLGAREPFRRFFITLVETRAFENFSMLAIACNCYVLAFAGRDETSILHIDPAVVATAEIAFAGLFTAELVAKSVAMGIFVDQYHSLLSDRWNQLDLLIVISAWLPFLFPALSGYTSLRALRAFRPLRAVNKLPGVKRQINTILRALPSLGNVALLMLFVISAFAILGMQLFKGTLQYRCYDLPADGNSMPPPGILPIDVERGVCAGLLQGSLERRALLTDVSASVPLPTASSDAGLHSTEVSMVVTNAAAVTDVVGGAISNAISTVVHSQQMAAQTQAAHVCPATQSCRLYGNNPEQGTVSFDNFFSSCMTVYMCITGEGWTDAMYLSMNAYHPAASYYFIALTLFGSFYVVNLFLAVLWEVYSQEGQKTDEIERRLQKISGAHAHKRDAAADAAAVDNGTMPLFDDGAPPPLSKWRLPSHVPSYKHLDPDATQSCHERLARFVETRKFRTVIMALIVMNILVMGVERHGMPEYQQDFVEVCNAIFFVVCAQPSNLPHAQSLALGTCLHVCACNAARAPACVQRRA